MRHFSPGGAAGQVSDCDQSGAAKTAVMDGKWSASRREGHTR